MPKSILSLSLLLCVGSINAAVFQSTVATGIPDGTGLSVTPDGRIFVLQRTGQVRLVENGILSPTPLLDLTVSTLGNITSDFTAGSQEHGLIGVTLDPNFSTNGHVYLHYNAALPGGLTANRVSRFTLNGTGTALLAEQQIIQNEAVSFNGHVGGGLAFGPDGKLYVTIGDRRIPADSQVTANTRGTVLRLNADGTFPMDNPFYAGPADLESAVFTYGLRNPFGLAVNPSNGLMLINDAGENSWEEINAVAFGSGIGAAPGANFGWPNCEGNYQFSSVGPFFSNMSPCSTLGVTAPLHAYGSLGTGDCAITGGTFYQGSYFFSDFCSGKVRQMDFSGNTANVAALPFFTLPGFGPSALATSADGNGIYYLERSGQTLGYLTTVPEPATLLTMALALGLLLLRQSRFQFRPASIKSLYRSFRGV